MNFISTFDELNKLYEEKANKVATMINAATHGRHNSQESCDKEALIEAAEDEEIEIVDDKPEMEVQLVLECNKCGALTIKAAEGVTVDEETGTANAGEPCTYCEAEEGHKVIGTFTPYVEEAPEEEPTEEVEEPAEEAEEAEEV
jgi:hypothetical protein